MKRFWVGYLLLQMVGMCHAQTVRDLTGAGAGKTSTSTLHCGKYQHVFHWEGVCGPQPPSVYAVTICLPPPPDKCEDDMHELTEREWQQTLARIYALENPHLSMGSAKR
jgi:hypothetical protein